MLQWSNKITAIAWMILLLFTMGTLTAAAAAQHMDEKTELAEITEPQSMGETTNNLETASKHGFNEEVDLWINELANQSCCADWSNANWTSYPLGPGTHAKLIELSSSSGEITGYFVLSATASGEWILTEYGTGRYPLFGVETLYKALAATELTPAVHTERKEMLAWIEEKFEVNRLYHHGLESLWALRDLDTNEIIYADAKTAEFYPLTKEDLDKMFHPGALSDTTALSDPVATDLAAGDPAATGVGWTLEDLAMPMKSLSFEVFDPFMHVYWLIAQPETIQDTNQLKHLLEKRPVTYVTALYQDSVTDPYAVTGLIQPRQTAQHSSSAAPFVAIDKYGSKYVPFKLLQNSGNFHSPEQ